LPGDRTTDNVPEMTSGGGVNVMKQRVLITGASRGIGRAIASKLSAAGFEVLGTSRDPERLTDKLEGVRYFRLDLDDPRSVEACCARVPDVDVLVNNAGVSQFGPLEEITLQQLERIFRVNIFGCVRMIQACLPGMRRRGSGTIINIGSLAGRFSPPFFASYAATKAAMAGLSWSLRNEVARYGVRVVLVEPSDIRTDITPEVFTRDASDYGADARRVLEIRNKAMAGAPPPEVVADKVARIVCSANPSHAYPVGGAGPLLAFVKRLLPDSLTEKLVRAHFGIGAADRD
jgi:NAD(P)-dependent dehydrogenase (short-subunit alcohol dehydrogenase family)